jgi:NAD(P) transhydrogenase subunit alpha
MAKSGMGRPPKLSGKETNRDLADHHPQFTHVWKEREMTHEIVESMGSLDLWSMVFVFMLATFIGFDVIRSVSRLLHTPLMSLTNAISAIAVVGSLIIAGEQKTTLSTVLGTVAVAASVTNIVSGFLITDRMLRMFKKREPSK